MAREEELGKLVVDIDADSSGLKRGLSTAKSALAKGISGMKSVLRGLTVSLIAVGAIGTAAIIRMSRTFLQQQKQIAITQNIYKSFAKNAVRSFKEVQTGMFNLARTTGVSTADQMSAYQKLLTVLNGAYTPEEIQDWILPITIDYAIANNKSPEEAAQDIAEALLDQGPESIIMPIKAKFELENPGKSWDELLKAERIQYIKEYLQIFAGSAEAASNTIFGAFNKIKTAIEELFNSIAGSADFQPLVDTLNDVADGIFNLAERIRNGDIPENLQGIIDGFNEFIPKVANWLKNLTWEKIEKFGNAIKNIALIIIGYGISDKAIELVKLFGVGKVAGEGAGGLKKFWDGLGGLGRTISLLLSGGLIAKLGDSIYELGRKIIKIPDPSSPFAEASSKLQKFLNNIGGMILRFGSTMKEKGFIASLASIPAELGKTFSNILGIFGVSVPAFAAVMATIVAFIAAWKENWGDLRDRTKEVFSDIADIFKKIWTDSIKPIIDSLLDMWETGYNTLKDMLAKFGIILPDFENLFVSLKDVVTFILKGLADNIGNIFAFIIETIGAAVKMVASVLGAIIEAISFFVDTVVAIGKTIIALFTGNFDEIDDIWKDWGKKTWQNIKDILGYFGDFLKAIGQWFTDLIASIGRGIGSIFGKADEFYNGIKQWFSNLIGGFGNWGSSIVGKLSDMKDGFGTKLAAAKDFLFGFGKDTSDKNNEIYSNTKNWTSNMGTKFKGFASNVGSTLKDAFGFGEAYAADMDSMYGDNERETGTWKSNMATKYAEFATVVSTKLNDAKESIKTKFGNIKDSFEEHKGILAGKVTEVLNEYETLKTNIKTKIEAVRSTMSTNLSVIASDVKTKFNEVITNVKSFGTNFYNSGAELFNKLKEGLSSKFSSILQSIGGFIQDAVDVVKDWYIDFKTAGKGLIDAFWDGAIEKWKAFKKWLDDKLQIVRDFLPGSDAKEGPLSTLTKAGRGLFSAMEDGMSKEFPNFLSQVKDAASQTAMNIPNSKDLAFQGVANQAATTGSTVVLNITDSYFTSDRAKQELIDMIDEGLGKKRK